MAGLEGQLRELFLITKDAVLIVKVMLILFVGIRSVLVTEWLRMVMENSLME